MLFLSHGYFLNEDPKERAIMKPYPPLGLLYLAAWLDRFGVENTVFDSTFSNKNAQYAAILTARPKLLAIYVNLMTKLNVLALMRWVRQQPELSQTPIVLGGPDVTHNAEEYLRAGADLIVVGEGEQTLLEVALVVRESIGIMKGTALDVAQFAQVPGLVFRWPDGGVHRTQAREKIRDIDDLPLPARHKIDLNRYLQVWKNAHGQSTLSISTQRGCPYTCRWCSTAVYGQSYRRRSPAKVVDEIAALQQTYAFDLIWFVDDVFTISHKWLEAFQAELDARAMQIRFECITRADRLNEEVLRRLKACGCFRVWIGAESGSQKIIDAMDRRVDVQQVRSMIQAANHVGIQTGTFIMLGYPGETEDDIRETVAHLCESNPDLFTITVAYPIKGTGLYEAVEAQTTAALPWEARTDREVDFPRTYPRRYYDFAVRWTVNAVYWHKAKLAKRQNHPKSIAFFGKKTLAWLGMQWYRRIATARPPQKTSLSQ